MAVQLLLATHSGIVIAQRTQAHWEQVGHTLAGERVTSIIVREGVALAGTHHGVLRSEDGGESWAPALAPGEGLEPEYVRWLAYHPDVSDHHAADEIGRVLPNAQRQTLEGQDHGPADDVLVPALVAFFLNG